jgi:hypothetical protein
VTDPENPDESVEQTEPADAEGDDQPESEGEQPDLDPDEQAVVPDDIKIDPDDVEADAGANDDADGDEGDDAGDESDADPGMSPDTSAGEWGEMYVSVVQTATNTIIEKHGDGHTVSEDHFTEQVPLDRYFNETLAEMGTDPDMPPQQALVVGTALAVGGPVVAHTDLLEQIADQFDGL